MSDDVEVDFLGNKTVKIEAIAKAKASLFNPSQNKIKIEFIKEIK